LPSRFESSAAVAALVRKDPAFYGALFPDADPELPYFWPVG
jgi:hypothetical protein